MTNKYNQVKIEPPTESNPNSRAARRRTARESSRLYRHISEVPVSTYNRQERRHAS